MISDNMWNESATSAIDLVEYPTIISTKKNDVVKNIIQKNAGRCPIHLGMHDMLLLRYFVYSFVFVSNLLLVIHLLFTCCCYCFFVVVVYLEEELSDFWN